MASAIELVFKHVRTMSTAGNYKELSEYLNKFSEILLKHGPMLDSALDTLNMQQHSLGYLAILCAKYKLSPNSDYIIRFNQTAEFINMCNGEQIRFAADAFIELCHNLTTLLIEVKQPVKGIEVLAKAITKLQMFDSQLTSVHADLCQLCLLAKCLKPALKFLDVDITAINNESNLGSRYFLLYYHYGGMIYLATKNYERALYCFEIVISTPALAVSHIMLESYKKYILTSLIVNGKVQVLSKFSPQVVQRFIKPLSQPYHDIATAYISNNCDEVKAVLIKNQEVFIRDKNVGLAKQVVQFLFKKNIQRLTKTFLTLSLSDVASRVRLSGFMEAEKYILDTIADGSIFACINQKDGMVVFQDAPEHYNNPAVMHVLDESMMACIELDKQILSMDEEISINPHYLKKFAGNQDDDMPPAAPSTKSAFTI
uniref:COP9 signalosome complex subunit 3 n=1 Tax=Xenopsylla cheopis TaxID=163159 RepID=A0A6M2DPH0_XENCH